MEDWAYVLRLLDRYSCPCGSGGPLACDDDCPGRSPQDEEAREAIRALIRAVHALERAAAKDGVED